MALVLHRFVDLGRNPEDLLIQEIVALGYYAVYAAALQLNHVQEASEVSETSGASMASKENEDGKEIMSMLDIGFTVDKAIKLDSLADLTNSPNTAIRESYATYQWFMTRTDRSADQ